MRYRDIPTAMTSMDAAFEDDPMMAYLGDIENTGVGIKRSASNRFILLVVWIMLVHEGNAHTADGGKACMSYMDPRQGHHLVDDVIERLAPASGVQASEELKKRQKEFKEKATKAIERALGDLKAEMFYLRLLFADPSKQGQGYGYTLAKIATDAADAAGRPIHLLSSNINNTTFYNSVGFVTVATFALGESNPKWNKPPVIVSVMLRKPAAACCSPSQCTEVILSDKGSACLASVSTLP